MNRNDRHEENASASVDSQSSGSKSMLDKMNDLSLAALTQWGVRAHNDHLWDQVHNCSLAHNPRRGVRPDNQFVELGFVFQLMLDEVHDELHDQKLI